MALQHLRSSTANKRPLPAGMSDGQLAINTNAASPGVFFKTSTGVLVKAGPVHVGTTAPNSSPASGGETGNTTGELWLDTSLTPNELKTWDGSAWVSATGQEIPVSKLIDGSARQLLQTDAAGTGVEWTSDVDVPGTLDVTSTATFDGRIYTILGSASTPAISPATDTNTGIAFSGTEAVNIVSNATTILSVEKDNATADVQVTGKISSTNTNTASAFIPTGTTAPTNGLYLPTTNSVALATNGVGRLFVDDQGRVGVGGAPIAGSPNIELRGSSTTSGPSLGVTTSNYSDNFTITSIRQYGTAATSTTAGLSRASLGELVFQNTSAGLVRTNGAAPIVFAVTDSERMRLTSDGRLGLGTSSPQLPFTIGAGGGANPATSGSTQSSGGIARLGSSGVATLDVGTLAAGPVWLQATNVTNLATNYSLLLNPNGGNVGIGTTSPATNLDLFATDCKLRVRDIGQTNGLEIYQQNADGGGRIFAANNNYLAFGTNNTERARIDSSGRLLVGTSTATNNLRLQQSLGVVAAGTNSYPGAAFTAYSGTNTAASPVIDLNRSRGTTDGSMTAVASNDYLGFLVFRGADGTGFIEAANIAAVVDGTPGTNDMPGRLVFSVSQDGSASPSERLRISNNGTTGIFATSSDATLYLSTAATAGTATPLVRGRYGATGMFGGTDSIFVWSNGNIQNTNNSYTAISDIKLKENIVDANSQWADIKALRVRNYSFKEGQTHKQIGLIAQEVEPISPGLVYETPDRDAEGNDLGTTTKAVQYSVLYMKAVKALQEAMERIETLEADVAALKAS